MTTTEGSPRPRPMPDSTLDARIAEAFDATVKQQTSPVFSYREWADLPEGQRANLVRFAEHLLASERAARADVEAKLVAAEQERDAYKKLCAEWRQSRDKDRADLTALRSQVASAKVEGAREALTRLSAECWAQGKMHPDAKSVDEMVLRFRDREYPAPATPSERVSGREVQNVELLVAERSGELMLTEMGYVRPKRTVATVTPELARAIVALAGGAE